MLIELDTVALTRDLPAAGLVAGDVGAIVHVYEAGATGENDERCARTFLSGRAAPCAS